MSRLITVNSPKLLYIIKYCNIKCQCWIDEAARRIGPAIDGWSDVYNEYLNSPIYMIDDAIETCHATASRLMRKYHKNTKINNKDYKANKQFFAKINNRVKWYSYAILLYEWFDDQQKVDIVCAYNVFQHSLIKDINKSSIILRNKILFIFDQLLEREAQSVYPGFKIEKEEGRSTPTNLILLKYYVQHNEQINRILYDIYDI